MSQISQAKVCFEQSTLYSKDCEDVYFSRFGGIQETEHVFLKGNSLPEAWSRKAKFVISEFGFGTGLNFLVTAKKWQESSLQNSELTYLSFENRPISILDLRQVFAFWPELNKYSLRLLEKLPEIIPGVWQIEFPEWRVKLILVYGNLLKYLPLISMKVDAWYFDGFSPSKNPELWSKEVFSQAFAKSNPGATFSTYSVSSSVQENLKAAGFSVEKKSGFAQKKSMLVGRLDKQELEIETNRTYKKIAVIGGGLAGSSVAYSLSKRGAKVVIFEMESELAKKASGNSAGILMPNLSIVPDLLSRFSLAGYFYSLRTIEMLRAKSEIEGESCGVIRLATSKRLQNLWKRLSEQQMPSSVVVAESDLELSQRSGVSLNSHGFFYPKGMWINPAKLCNSLVEHANDVSCLTSARVLRLEFVDGEWILSVEFSSGKIIEEKFDAIVIANAEHSGSFLNLSWLPLEAVRGQVASIKTNSVLSNLKTVVCYDGYITPKNAEIHALGATFSHDDFDLNAREEDNIDLASRLSKWVANIEPKQISFCSSRAAFRTSTPDRMPIIGKLSQVEDFEKCYREANNRNYGDKYPENAVIQGLFVTTGHGAKGLTSCLLAGEIISAQIFNETIPIESDLLSAVDARRFLVRMVTRGESGYLGRAISRERMTSVLK